MDRISEVLTGSQVPCLGLQSSVSLSGNQATDTGPGQPGKATVLSLRMVVEECAQGHPASVKTWPGP